MSYLNSFLKTEITCIPKILRKCFGDYYNNSLSNGATWMFMLWGAIHLVFDICIDALLKKLRYREYVRLRLQSSLWYLGFYGTALIYCGAKLFQNEVELFNFKKMHVPSSTSLPTHMILGYTLISTFYLHTAFWEGLRTGQVVNMFRYLFLFIFTVSSFILRIVEISFSLTALISIAQIGLEFTRSAFISSSQESFFTKLFLTSVFIAAFVVYVSIHIIVVPLTFVAPLGLKIMSDYPNALLIILFLNLVAWLMVEIYQSVLFKVVDHWLYHMQHKDKTDSDSEAERSDPKIRCALMECSLFQARDDFAYNIRILRKEISDRKNRLKKSYRLAVRQQKSKQDEFKEPSFLVQFVCLGYLILGTNNHLLHGREEWLFGKIAMRKPRNVFLQTLKCMVAMKRKLSERRLSGHFQLAEETDDKNEDSNENLAGLELEEPEDRYKVVQQTSKVEEDETSPLNFSVKRSEEVLSLHDIENDEKSESNFDLIERISDFENETLLTSIDNENTFDNDSQKEEYVKNVNENKSKI